MYNLIQPQKWPTQKPAAVEIAASNPRSLRRPVVTHGTSAAGIVGMYI